MPSTAPGVTSASLIVIILTGAAIGALVGGILGPYLETAPLAIAAGFIATIVAVIVRNKLLNRFSGVGPDDFQIPMVVAVFAVIASIAGSLASKGYSIRSAASSRRYGPVRLPGSPRRSSCRC